MFRKKISSFFYKHPVVILLVFFCISLAVRVPNLNRPLSKHHEVNAALVLINAEEWNRKTPAFYYYVPVHSYHLPGDNISEDIIKENGYLVNISFGTLWYIMPYLFFQILHAQPSPLLLQVFNLLLHLVTVLLVYKLAFELFVEPKASLKALVTAVIYLFSPAPLWFQGNSYVHEVAVLPFIYAVCLWYIRLIKNEKPPLFQYLLFTLVIIAGICCDWLMCFVAAAIFITSLWFRLKTGNSKYVACMVASTLAVIIAISVTAFQFSAFMGFENYSKGLLSRFISRGITGDVQAAGLLSSAGLASFYLTGYGILIPLTACLFVFPSYRKRITQNHLLTSFLIIAAITCLLHHIVFWGFSNIHDYAVLKSGFVISLLSAVALFSLQNKRQQVIALTAILFINTGLYYFINRPGKYAINGQPYTYFQSLGEKMKAIASPDDYIFIDTPEMSLLLTYYSKRYYRNVKDMNEANTFFKQLSGKEALFIHTVNFEFISATRLKK